MVKMGVPMFRLGSWKLTRLHQETEWHQSFMTVFMAAHASGSSTMQLNFRHDCMAERCRIDLAMWQPEMINSKHQMTCRNEAAACVEAHPFAKFWAGSLTTWKGTCLSLRQYLVIRSMDRTRVFRVGLLSWNKSPPRRMRSTFC